MNLHDALVIARQQRTAADLTSVRELLRQQGEQETALIARLGLHASDISTSSPALSGRALAAATFAKEDVQRVCVQYRMRMLPSHRYRGPIDPEFGVKLRAFQKQHQLTDTDWQQRFFIVAPAETFEVDQRQNPAVDPLLLYQTDAKHYQLVHQWGHDLHPLRLWRSWRHRSLMTMTLYWSLITFLCAAVTLSLLAESLVSGLTITTVSTLLVGWGYYTVVGDHYERYRHQFSDFNWDQDWVY